MGILHIQYIIYTLFIRKIIFADKEKCIIKHTFDLKHNWYTVLK